MGTSCGARVEGHPRVDLHRPVRRLFHVKGDILGEAANHLDALAGKIAATPANTFAGLAIKLRIGTDNQPFRLYPDFQKGDLGTDGLNLMSALADAERLAGGMS